MAGIFNKHNKCTPIDKPIKKNMNTKNTIIEKSEFVYQNDLNIYTILKKLQEIDRLKFLILNDQQMELFSLIEAPNISVVYENKKKLDLVKKEEKVKELIDYYKKNEKISELDIRLIQLIQKE